MKKFDNLSTITVNCKKFCKIFTWTKLTDILYRFCCIFQISRKTFCKIRKLSYTNFLLEFGYVNWAWRAQQEFLISYWNYLCCIHICAFTIELIVSRRYALISWIYSLFKTSNVITNLLTVSFVIRSKYNWIRFKGEVL